MPQALHPHGKRSHVKVSLGTSDNHTALQLSQTLTYMGHHLINKASGYGMRYDEIRKLLKDHFTKLLDKRKKGIAERGRLSDFDVSVLQSSIGISEDRDFFRHPDKDQTTHTDRLIASYGLSIVPGDPTYQIFETELMASYRAYCQQDAIIYSVGLGRLGDLQ